jgi:predicted PurR-regulated permease PerM
MGNRTSRPWGWLTEARVTYVLKVLMAIVLALYILQVIFEFLTHIPAVVYIMIASVFLTYLLYPAVNRLSRRMPLLLAIVLVYAVIIAVIVLAISFVVPRLADESTLLVRRYPEILSRFHSLVYNPRDPITSHLPDWVRQELATMPSEIIAFLKVHGAGMLGHVVPVIAGAATVIATFIIVPLITAYLLLDLDRLRGVLAAIVPREKWHSAFAFLAEVDAVIGGFIRGQMIVALCVGILITIAMLLLHVPYAFLLGLLAGVTDLIPYVGAVMAFIPAFISALLVHGLGSAFLVLLAFVAIYEFEGHIIAPNVVGRQVHLSPFVVLLALLIGAELGGIVGMLVAIPIAGALRVLVRRVVGPAPWQQ